MTRLKTEIWVQALLRRFAVEGKNAVVLHRGHSDAGAVMVVVNRLDGSHSLLAPAPGPAYDDAGDRRFVAVTSTRVDWLAVSEKIQRARSFDADLWVVEVEDRDGLGGLTLSGA